MVSARRRSRPQESGFTLIEIMIVCVILAILAAIVIPQFMEETRKTKSNSEVTAMFAEIGVREEQYRVENGSYFQPAGGACPASPAMAGQIITCANAGQPWAALNVKVPTDTATCAYTISAGTGGGAVTVGTVFTFTPPTGVWYHILAECNQNGDATLARFFTSSVNSSIQKSNENE